MTSRNAIEVKDLVVGNGDVTAVRDLIAISIGLCEDPKKK